MLCIKRIFQSFTVKRFLPFFLRPAKTERPPGEDIRFLKPCVFFLLRLLFLIDIFILINLIYSLA